MPLRVPLVARPLARTSKLHPPVPPNNEVSHLLQRHLKGHFKGCLRDLLHVHPWLVWRHTDRRAPAPHCSIQCYTKLHCTSLLHYTLQKLLYFSVELVYVYFTTVNFTSLYLAKHFYTALYMVWTWAVERPYVWTFCEGPETLYYTVLHYDTLLYKTKLYYTILHYTWVQF